MPPAICVGCHIVDVAMTGIGNFHDAPRARFFKGQLEVACLWAAPFGGDVSEKIISPLVVLHASLHQNWGGCHSVDHKKSCEGRLFLSQRKFGPV